jgi:uncharacterized protein YdeI (YjbR/CyaY-like superfamily)
MVNWSELNTLYVYDRIDWRGWLENNYETESEIYLLYAKKASGLPRISYNDAVEEALCFGWIDSIIRKYNEDFSAQRYSPRKNKTRLSQPNVERLRWLQKEGLLHPKIEAEVKEIISQEFVFPEDIIEELRKDEVVWKNYQSFSDGYKRIRIAYIDGARKRPEEFEKRFQNFIKKTRANKIIGFGGIEKYF